MKRMLVRLGQTSGETRHGLVRRRWCGALPSVSSVKLLLSITDLLSS